MSPGFAQAAAGSPHSLGLSPTRLYGYTFCLSTHLLMDVGAGSTLRFW